MKIKRKNEMVMMVMDMDEWNQGYASDLGPLTPDEADLVERLMIVGINMKDANGLVNPFRLPPAVALALARELREKDSKDS